MKQRRHITNRYEVIDKLGQGAMGAVWRVHDRLEVQEVALKQVLLPETQLVFASKASTNDIDKLRLSLAHEFSLLATLRHPHILSVLDFGFDDDGHPFYTMTLLEGSMDFKSYAKDLSPDEKIRVLTQMLQALHYLHRRGILHRDLKPDNVIIDKNGQVKIMDFGLAKKANKDAPYTQGDSISGTIMYMSPELFQATPASVSSDLYAFGLMAYEILVGKYPFEFDSIGSLIMKLMTEAPDTSMLSTELSDWLQQLLRKKPDDRSQSAYEVLHGLYAAHALPIPLESQLIRESFLNASEFIGRDAELKQLTDALNTLEDASAFFLVGGESGVGKSRLLDELRIEALIRDAIVIRGQAVEGGGLPFQLWRNIVRRMLLVVDITEMQASILKDIVPDMNLLLGREIDNALDLTGLAYQQRMVVTIVDLFRKLTRPVVLLLEDLQWATESLAVLQQMLKVPEQLSKLMVVANYRNDESTTLAQKLAGMAQIKLERLTSDAVSELSTAMLGDVGVNEAVIKLLHSQSEGNLFFLVETVRVLAETSGNLQRIAEVELPDGVFTGGMQALTRRRLSKVDAQYKDLQTFAAVIGRELDLQLLAHAYADDMIQAWLSSATEYAVLEVRDNRWRFVHDKLRETIIVDVHDDEKSTIHRHVAEAIEAIYPEDAGYNDALLGHWQHVGDLDKTYHYTLPVAQNLIEIKGTYIIAETLLQRLLDRLPANDARRVAPLNWLADSAERQSNYDLSKTYASQAQQLATMYDDLQGLATSLYQLGNIARYRGDYERATDLHQQSLTFRQQVGDKRRISASLNNLGNVAYSQADYEWTMDLYQQSLTIRQELDDQLGISASLNNMGVVAWHQGDYGRATDLLQQSLAIKQKLGDQLGISQILGNFGLLASNQKDYEVASDLHQQSLAIEQRLGDQSGIARSLNNLGVVAYSQKNYERARDLFQQGLVIQQALGDQRSTALTLSNLGRASHQLNDNADTFFHEGLRLARAIQVVPFILLNVIGFAQHLIRQNQAKRAGSLTALAEQHPAADANVHQYIEELMPELEAALSSEELAQAIEQGKSFDMDAVVQELLDEFADEAIPED